MLKQGLLPLFSFISFFFCNTISTIPFLPTTSLSPHEAQKNELIKLISTTIDAHRYWENYHINAFTKNLSFSLKKRQFFLQSDEVESNKQELFLLQKKMAELLQQLIIHHTIDSKEFSSIMANAQLTLNQHDMPSHFKRHWLKYVAGTICTSFIYYQIRDFLDNRILFSFQTPKEHAVEANKFLRELPHTENSSPRFHFTYDNDKEMMIVWTNTTDACHIQNALNLRFPHNYNVTAQPLPLSYLPYYLYNDDGISFFQAFYNKCFQEPLENIKDIILNAPTKRSASNVANINEITIHKQEKQTLLQEGYALYHSGDTTFEHIFRKYPDEQSFSSFVHAATTEQLNEMRNAMITKSNITSDIISMIRDSTITPIERYIWKDKQNSNVLSFRAAFSKYIEDTLHKINDLTRKVDDTHFITELATQTSALSPSLGLMYLITKGTSNTFDWRYKQTVINPLICDLKDFSHFLDFHKNKPIDTDYFKGMLLYWTEKLRTYIPKIKSNRRIYFNRDVEKLASQVTVEHRMSIIETILYYEITYF